MEQHGIISTVKLWKECLFFISMHQIYLDNHSFFVKILYQFEAVGSKTTGWTIGGPIKCPDEVIEKSNLYQICIHCWYILLMLFFTNDTTKRITHI